MPSLVAHSPILDSGLSLRRIARFYRFISDQQEKGKGSSSPYSITESRVPELIAVLGSQPVDRREL